MSESENKKTAANAKKKQQGKPFKKGQSGNPAGKKPGTKNRATLAAKAFLDGDSVHPKIIDFGLQGDTTALRLR